MALVTVSNHGLGSVLPSAPLQALPSVALPRATKIVSSLAAISSSPVTSAHSATQSSNASSSSASDSVVPQSVLDTLSSYVSPTQQAWNSLAQSLRLGDLASAQSALNSYTASLSAPNSTSLLKATTPSDTFLADLKSVGDALAAGSLENARTAFATANTQRPDTAAEAVDSAQSLVEGDGWIALYTLEHPGSGAIDQSALASDIAGLDGALREEQANIGDELVALGYSRTDANKYADALTGIVNSSAADNTQVDASRSTQWIQGLIATAQNEVNAHGPSDQVSNNLSNTPSALLTSIEFTNIDGWRQLEALIGATLDSTTGSAGAASPGVRLNAVA